MSLQPKEAVMQTMSPELAERLYQAFPRLFRHRLQQEGQSCLHRGIECGDEWYERLYRHCEVIEALALEQGQMRETDSWPEVRQIKMKLGVLRFYLSAHASHLMVDLSQHIGEPLDIAVGEDMPDDDHWLAVKTPGQACILLQFGLVRRISLGYSEPANPYEDGMPLVLGMLQNAVLCGRIFRLPEILVHAKNPEARHALTMRARYIHLLHLMKNKP